tara:strand:- start:668 stop:1414 length:747 start_codon:yes stop_codon:yes gene_type:complete
MQKTSPAATAAKEKIVEDILKDLPIDSSLEVELPSENKVYTLEDPGAPITLRPMTFEDEKQIINAKKDQDPVNIILQRCTTNINISELLSIDKLYLIMKLREISYGDDYNTLMICSNCNTENPLTVKLSQLNVNPVPDDFTDPVEVTLPTINKLCKVSLPRVRDEKLLTNVSKTLDEIWRFIKEIDGQTDKSIISAVVNKLPIRDMKTILNAMKTEFGVDTKIKFGCNNCKEVSVIDLPIDANFFDVS